MRVASGLKLFARSNYIELLHARFCERHSPSVEAMRYFDFWSNEIWPKIQEDFTELLTQRPRRQDDFATGRPYGSRMYEQVEQMKEIRQVTCNLCWTSPSSNTNLQADISLEVVQNFAMDIFIEAAPKSDESAVSAPESAVSAAEDAEALARRKTAASAKETDRDVAMAKKRTFKVPDRVPKHFNIPIALTSVTTEATKGEFQRLGMDIVVNGTWLCYYWAKVDNDADAQQRLKNLILDWPFDFSLYEAGDGKPSIEEQILQATLNLPMEVEILRDHCGLDGKNLMLIAMEVLELLQRQKTSRVAKPEEVHEWMTTGNRIKWGHARVPSLKVVKSMLQNGAAIKRNPAVAQIMDRARAQFGRDNHFDFPTKIGTLLSGTRNNDSQLLFVCDWIFAHMLRT